MSSRLTPMDIEKQSFRSRMRGYDPEEVHLFLKSVAEEIERLNLESEGMREELGGLRRQAQELRNREVVLQQTLVSAQQMTEEMKDRGRSEADLLVRQARIEAERILLEAREQLTRIESEISRCKLERDVLEQRLLARIDEHRSLIEQRREQRVEDDKVHVLRPRTSSETG